MSQDDFKTTVRLKADFGDRVFIKELELYGTVAEISIGRSGTLYRIDYFHNGDHKSAWLNHYLFERQQ